MPTKKTKTSAKKTTSANKKTKTVVSSKTKALKKTGTQKKAINKTEKKNTTTSKKIKTKPATPKLTSTKVKSSKTPTKNRTKTSKTNSTKKIKANTKKQVDKKTKKITAEKTTLLFFDPEKNEANQVDTQPVVLNAKMASIHHGAKKTSFIRNEKFIPVILIAAALISQAFFWSKMFANSWILDDNVKPNNTQASQDVDKIIENDKIADKKNNDIKIEKKILDTSSITENTNIDELFDELLNGSGNK